MAGLRHASGGIRGVVALAVLATAPAHAAPRPLFATETILRVRIEAPFSRLIRAAPHSTTAFDGTLAIVEPTPETLPVQLSARGISRRNPANCEFPPIRIEFKEKPGAASLFKGQKSLKLVTHCRSDSGYQDYSLLEYAAYKLLNVLTPASFRVRMAEIDYVEASSGSVRIHRHGFLVEESRELAERNGMKEVKADRVALSQVSADATARSDLFQYLIGNLDWSDFAAVPGTNCCHNIKMLGSSADSRSDLIPVAYDFDSSGFVNAPYAKPPEMVPVDTVRTRYYRGLCKFNVQATEAARQMLEQRTALLSAITSTPALSQSAKDSASQYLQSFFNVVSDPTKLQHVILDHCRG